MLHTSVIGTTVLLRIAIAALSRLLLPSLGTTVDRAVATVGAFADAQTYDCSVELAMRTLSAWARAWAR